MTDPHVTPTDQDDPLPPEETEEVELGAWMPADRPDEPHDEPLPEVDE